MEDFLVYCCGATFWETAWRSVGVAAIRQNCNGDNQRLRLLGPTLMAALLTTALWIEGASAFRSDQYLSYRANGSIPWVQTQETETSGTFRGVGVVTAIDSDAGALTINHEEIKGLMSAMIMMYRIEPFSLTAGLRQGDRIEFTLDAKTYTIRDVKLIARTK
jgi:Cu/Ag efflux protein CusF